MVDKKFDIYGRNCLANPGKRGSKIVEERNREINRVRSTTPRVWNNCAGCFTLLYKKRFGEKWRGKHRR